MRALVYTVLCTLVACSEKAPPPEAEAPRPVTVVVLKEMDPVRPLLLTGSVESWKEADVSFETEGRVKFIVESGTHLDGRWVEGGTVRAAGDVLARLDTRDYEISRDRAAAAVDVAREQIATATVQLEKVLPASRDKAKANRDRAEAEYIRYRQAGEQRAVSEIDVIKAKADFDAMEASLQEALADIDAKASEIKSLDANHEEAKQVLAQAEFDLSRCELYAPFSAAVSEVLVEAGGYARRGQPVAHLVMMTPIKVDLAVSRETMARLRRGDAVLLYTPGSREPMRGSVYEKGTVADRETRTFRVSIITSNTLSAGKIPDGDPRAAMPRIKRTMTFQAAKIAPHEGRFYAEETHALRKDGKGYFVWADPNYTEKDSVPDGTVLNLRKFRVVPGDRRGNLQGIYLIRELTDIGDLKPGMLIPLDVPQTDADELQVVMARPQWLLRPGQIVDVLLKGEAPAPGLYVPLDAIDAKGAIFVADQGKARRVEARIGGRIGELARVEGEGLRPGALVITDYIHFLKDGEPVRVVRRREIAK